MEDKYILACVGVICLVGYGCVALYTGHNGNTMTTIITVVGGIVAGTIGFALGKKG